MGRRVSSQEPGATMRRVAAKARSFGAYLFYERTVLLLAVIFCLGVAGTLWHFSRLSSLTDTFMLLSTMGFLGLGGLALVIGRMRNTSHRRRTGEPRP